MRGSRTVDTTATVRLARSSGPYPYPKGNDMTTPDTPDFYSDASLAADPDYTCSRCCGVWRHVDDDPTDEAVHAPYCEAHGEHVPASQRVTVTHSHQGCRRCGDAEQQARGIKRATGSLEATVTLDDVNGSHAATVTAVRR